MNSYKPNHQSRFLDSKAFKLLMAGFILVDLFFLGVLMAIFLPKLGWARPESKLDDHAQVLAAATMTDYVRLDFGIPVTFNDTVRFQGFEASEAVVFNADIQATGQTIDVTNGVIDLTGGQLIGVDFLTGITTAEDSVITIGGTATAPTLEFTGITSIESLTGAVDIAGSGSVTVSGSGDTITITGSEDAETLDSIDSNSFLRSDTSDTFSSGKLTFSAGTFFDLGNIIQDGINQGLRLPQADTLASPSTTDKGFLAYNTSTDSVQFFDGSTWQNVGSDLFDQNGSFLYINDATNSFGIAGSTAPWGNNAATDAKFYFSAVGDEIILEGATSNGSEIRLVIEDPAADQTITIPGDATGEISLLGQSITPSEIDAINSPTDNYVLKYDQATGRLEWATDDGGVGGATLFTDGGTYTYLTSTTDDLMMGSNITDQASFFFDVSTGNIVLEGSSQDAFETTLQLTNPTADRTITIPNSSGTIALDSDLHNAVTVNPGTYSYLSFVSGTQTLTLNQIDISTDTNLAGTAGRITISGDAVDISSSYVGQNTITTLGTVTTGTWNATALTDAYVSDTITVGASGSVNDAALSANVAHLNVAETIASNWVNTANPWADNEVVDALTINSGTISNSAITIAAVIAPSTTTEGYIEWDSDDNLLVIGDGEDGTQIFYPGTGAGLSDTNASTICNGTYSYLDGDGNCDDFTVNSLAYQTTINNDDWSGTDLAVANGGTGASDAAGARTNLGLVINTDVQAYHTALASIAGLTTSANEMLYLTGSNTYATTALSAFGRGLIDDADAATARITLGLVIDTDVQGYDAVLSTLAGLDSSDSNIIVGSATGWVVESGSTARTSLGVGTGDSPQFTGLTLSGDGDLQGNITLAGNAAFNGAFTLGGVNPVTAILDEDNMATNSNTALATQQSIKTYVDAQVGGVGGASTLDELTDVVVSAVSDAQILIYDGTTDNQWENVTVSGDIAFTYTGGATIQDNAVDGTDIALGSDAAGDIMYYNGTDWVALVGSATDGYILKYNDTTNVPYWAANDGGTGAYSGWNFAVDGVTQDLIDSGDILDFVSGSGITVTRSADDQLTFTATDTSTTNELQNLFESISSDSGSTTANSQTDTLTIAGGGIAATSILGDTLTITATEAQQLFSTIAVSGQSDITSDALTDTLTFEAGSNISLTTNAATDTLTIAVTGLDNYSSWNISDGVTSTGISSGGTATFTAGTGITVGESSGTITITNAGVTSLSGTTDQVNVSGATGSITLSLPQSINTTSSPTFAGLTLSGAADFQGAFTLGGANPVTAILDEDDLSSNSNTALATQQSTKAYVDSQITATNFWDRTGTTLSPLTAGDVLSASSGGASTTATFTATGANNAFQAGGAVNYLIINANGNLNTAGNIQATGTITANTNETINGIDINSGAISDIVSLNLTDAGNTWSSGNLNVSGIITGGTFTDGTATITSGDGSGFTSFVIDSLNLDGTAIGLITDADLLQLAADSLVINGATTVNGVLSGVQGISSTGNIDFGSLSAGGLVKAAATTGRLSIATVGTDYESGLTFQNGLTRTANTITLGGTLTQDTTISQTGAYTFTFTNNSTGNTTVDLQSTGDFEVLDGGSAALHISGDTGNVGIGNNSPTNAKLDVTGDVNITTDITIGNDLITTTGSMISLVADGSSATAFTFNSQNPYSTAGAKLFSVQNNGTEAMYVDKDGNLYVTGNIISGNGTYIITLTNKSGGARSVGDLVVIDTANDSSFTITTTAYDSKAFGIVVGGNPATAGDTTCSADESCQIAVKGKVTLNVNNPVSRGDYLFSSTNAGYAKAAGALGDGVIGLALTADATAPYTTTVLMVPQLESGGGGAMFMEEGAAIANNSCVTVNHNQNTDDITTQGWVYDTGAGEWIDINAPEITGKTFSNTGTSVADGSYITVNHAQDTNDLTATGWVKNGATWEQARISKEPKIASGRFDVPASTGNYSVTGLSFQPDMVKFSFSKPSTTGVYIGTGQMTASQQSSQSVADSTPDIAVNATRDSDYSIPTTATQNVPFNTETYDTDSMHSTSSNMDRLTFNTAGKYIVTFNVRFGGTYGAVGAGRVFCSILSGGTARIGVSEGYNSSGYPACSVSTTYDFAAGNYVSNEVYQDGGSTESLYYTQMNFSAYRLGDTDGNQDHTNNTTSYAIEGYDETDTVDIRASRTSLDSDGFTLNFANVDTTWDVSWTAYGSEEPYTIVQQDTNNVRLYNYSGAAKDLRLDVATNSEYGQGFKIKQTDANTTELCNYSGSAQQLKLVVSTHTGTLQPGLYTNSNTTLANGDYIEINHNRDTNSVLTNGWIFVNGEWTDIATATQSGTLSTTNASVANNSYIDVTHNQHTYDVNAAGWVYDTTNSKWIDINSPEITGKTYTQSGTSVPNNSYIEVAHNQNTTNPTATGWVYDSTATKWIDINSPEITGKDFSNSGTSVANGSYITVNHAQATNDLTAVGYVKNGTTWEEARVSKELTYLGEVQASTDISTTSTTWVDTGTNLTVNMPKAGNAILYIDFNPGVDMVTAGGSARYCSGALYNNETATRINLGGHAINPADVNEYGSGQIGGYARFTGLSAGSNTFKLQWMAHVGNINCVSNLSTGQPYHERRFTAYMEPDSPYVVVQTDTNNIRLYNYSGAAQDLRLAVHTNGTYGQGFKIMQQDANTVRLYNYSGAAKDLRLQVNTPSTYGQGFKLMAQDENTTRLYNYSGAAQNLRLAIPTQAFQIKQVDSNTVRLYNYSGSAANARLDIIAGGVDNSSAGTVSLAPSSADTDTNDNSTSLWINKTGTGGNLIRLQQSGTNRFLLTADGNLTISGDLTLDGGDLVGANGAAIDIGEEVSGDVYINTDVLIGGTSETLSNTGFVMNGNDLFVADSLGVEGNIYTDGSFIAGSGTLTLSDTGITDSNSALYLTSTNDGIILTLGGGIGDDFIVDTDTLVVESDNNRVGIGTTTPSATLDIVGNIAVSGTVDGRDIAADGSNLDNLYTTIGLSALTAAEVNQLESIGATTISATQWGYLGALDQNLYTSASPTFTNLTLTGNILMNNTQVLQAKNSSGTTETWMWPRWSDNVTYTNFGSAGWNIRNNSSANVMFLQNGGNVGIGTTSPDQKLDVGNGAVKMGNGYAVGTRQGANYRVEADWTYQQGDGVGSVLSQYVTFTTAFSATPIITATANAYASSPPSNLSQCTNSTAQANMTTHSQSTTGFYLYSSHTGTTSTSAYYCRSWMAYGTTSQTDFDLAESYRTKDSSITSGDVVCIDPNNNSHIVKCTQDNQSTAIGIVSTEPGLIIGDELRSDSRLVGLQGRVPVKVTIENGPIQRGDLLTPSTTKPGYAMKATTAGQIIGKALQPFDGTSTIFGENAFDGLSKDRINQLMEEVKTTGEGQTMAFINISYNDPDAYLTNNGDVIITQSGSDYTITDQDNQPITRIGRFSDAAIANLTTGRINTSKIIFNGQDLTDYLSQNLTQGIQDVLTDHQSRITQLEQDLEDLTNSYQILANNSATMSALLQTDPTDTDFISVTQPIIFTEDAIFTNIFAYGDTALKDTFVDGTLTIIGTDNTLSLDQSGISAIGTTLKLQPTGLHGIDLLAGQVTIDQLGNMNIKGNFTVEGDTQLQDTQVLGVFEATGSAVLGETTTTKLTTDTIIVTNNSAGTARIPVGQDHISITYQTPHTYTPIVTVTPEDHFVPFNLSARDQNGFTIKIQNPTYTPLEFTWIAVGLQNNNPNAEASASAPNH